MTILAATYWRNNAALIADVHRLGYIRKGDRVLDPTYGRGKWWTVYRPADLTIHDLKLDGVDFTKMVDENNRPIHERWEFDVIAFDPPYVSVGGRTTSGIPDMHDAYGLTEAPKSPEKVQGLINAGMAELHYFLRPGGIMLVKCQSYVSSGKLFRGVYETEKCAEALGLKCIDEFVHLSKASRPQPAKRTRIHRPCKGQGCEDCQDGRIPTVQAHARRNESRLLVFRRPGRAPRR